MGENIDKLRADFVDALARRWFEGGNYEEHSGYNAARALVVALE